MSEEYKNNHLSGDLPEGSEEKKDSEQGTQNTSFVLKDEEQAGQQEPGKAPTPENPVYAHSYRNEERKEGYSAYRFTSPKNEQEPEKEGHRKEPKKPMSTGKKIAALVGGAVAFGLIAGGVFLGVGYAGYHLFHSEDVQVEQTKVEETKTPITTDVNADSTQGSTVAQVAKNTMPSIVSITGISIQEIPNYFGFGTQEYQGESSGSGIIVGQNDTELLIATNNHVIAGANSITVCFTNQDGTAATSSTSGQDQVEQTSADGEALKDGTYVEAKVKGTDSDNDLAVIAVQLSDIPKDILEEIKVAVIGDSDALTMGEQVVAIGNALGYGQSVTSGYVSGLNKKVSSDNVDSTFIQTDAAINPGNSGGALLNMKGELVGINSAKIASDEVEGMGFAIPVSRAEPILDELMSKETRDKVEDENKASYLGITCIDSTSTSSEMYNIPQGVFVREVEEGGPADKAGIKKGDVIKKIDGTTVSTSENLIDQLEYYEAGEKIDFVISRAEGGEYKEQTITVELGAKKDSSTANPGTSAGR